MIREKTSCDFTSENVIKNICIIKGYFEKRNAICSMSEESIYQFIYKDKIRNKEKNIFCSINLKEVKAKIKISRDIQEEDSIYEIDDLIDYLYADLMKILFGGENRYVVRIYGSYYLAKPLDLHDTFNWKNNINLISYEVEDRDTVYNVDSITACPKEQIFYCDIEVYAFNLSAARSMAYNLFLEFTTLLSVLLDIGFKPFTTRENLLLFDQKIDGNMYNFWGTVASNGFDDQELGIFVFDNMNGLIAISDSGKMVLNHYLNINANGVTVTQSSNNVVLENIFKNRTFSKIKKKRKCELISDEIVFYNSCPEIVSEHCSFYRKIISFEKDHEKEYKNFYNACKLYNYAHCIGNENPTVMVSYLVASVETLSKTEISDDYQKQCCSDMDRFVSFCRKYYNEDFDEKFMKYLYGKIRSGHFHSGVFSFFEYNCNLDLSFESEFFKFQDIYIQAKLKLRKVILMWIRKN
ncbi:MAG: hypothetical protein K2J99_02885, partial [Lachnospiraceae bacterium]|nr:hypothetical protein [Lachnospiraceae bacterium]